MRRTRNAKIVATLGPASSDKETVRQLFLAGVDVFRLNFSHGSHEDHRARFNALRELEEETPYRADSVELMRTFFTAPGFCDEKMYVYRAVGVQEGSRLQPDQDEFVETVLLDKAGVRAALQAGEISDAKTIVALQDWLMES